MERLELSKNPVPKTGGFTNSPASSHRMPRLSLGCFFKTTTHPKEEISSEELVGVVRLELTSLLTEVFETSLSAYCSILPYKYQLTRMAEHFPKYQLDYAIRIVIYEITS